MWNGIYLAGRIFLMMIGEGVSIYLLQHQQENWGEIVGGIVVLYGVLTGNYGRTWSLSLSVISALAGLMFGLATYIAKPEHYLLHTTLFLFAFAMFVVRYIVSFRGSMRRVFRKTDW